MNAFDDAWLRQHEQRMASMRSVPPPGVVTQNLIAFTLPEPTLLMNKWIKMSWPERYKYTKALSAKIAALVPSNPHHKPFHKSAILIRRVSTGEPDYDGIVGGAKPLLDCLVVRSMANPHGLSFIVNDGPSYISTTYESERISKRADQRTLVTIERVG